MYITYFGSPLLVTAICVIFLFLFVLLVFLITTNKKMSTIIRFDQEKYFIDPSKDPPTKCAFPSLSEPASVNLSVIIPSYNEEARLPKMLDECIAFLEQRVAVDSSFSYELIVVDDGSSDRTTDVALRYVKRLGVEKMRVLTLVRNRGKGGAVRLGMLSARGEYVLFADADGATKFGDLQKLEEVMRELCRESDRSVVVGSRAHLEKEAVATRSFFRTVLMYGFHSLVWLFGVRGIRDTQCGFKLFTRKSASALFHALHVERWAFDVELLYIARQLDMTVREVAVNWTEIEGSKLVPVWSWVQMGLDLLTIWLKYQTRLWVIETKTKVA